MGTDATAELCFRALLARDFGALTSRFDAAVAASLDAERLAVTWDAQVAALGEARAWSIVERAQANGLDVRVARLTFERGELDVVLSFHPSSQQIGGIFFRSPRPPATSAPYVDATRFRCEAVSVGSAPFVLGGTLALPAGDGPFPGVVLVHGSGPHDRDETVGATRPFKDLAEGLATRGVAVLRYDKRTFAHRGSLGPSITVDDEVVNDAVAALAVLRARPSIDARRVFVAGHSLGALLAPEIGVRGGPVAGVILLAPPGRPPWDAVVAQMRYLEASPEQLAAIERIAQLLRDGAPEAPPLLGAPAAYWRDWASRDGVAAARTLCRPIMILHGGRDYQVTDDDLSTWREGLRDVPDVTWVTLPAANHLFVEGSGKPSPAEYARPGHVSLACVEHIARFVAAH